MRYFIGLFCLWCLFVLACNLPVTSSNAQELPGGTKSSKAATPTPAFASTQELTANQRIFPGLNTALPLKSGQRFPTLTVAPEYYYITRSGDTMAAVAGRFNLDPAEIQSGKAYPPDALLPSGVHLEIANRIGEVVRYSSPALPDSEIIESPSTTGFNLPDYVQQVGGSLSHYSEIVDHQTLSGAEIVQRVSLENSINPRILLAVLDFRSHWVTGAVQKGGNPRYPIGFQSPDYTGLFKELLLTSRQLTTGYYGWRAGSFTRMTFTDRTTARIDPNLNAGTVALQNLFAGLYPQDQWAAALYGEDGFLVYYTRMFDDPWARAAKVEPLFPQGIASPVLELPFAPGEAWSFTGGPHAAWGVGSPRGGLDFAPVGSGHGCTVATAWVTASSPGLVVRSTDGVVAINVEGKNDENSGWVMIYLHIAEQDRIAAGTRVSVNDRLGHPSCEGGVATGTNLHIARKFNGEWIPADGPLPFILSGWHVHTGKLNYQGTLVKAEQRISARSDGSRESLIIR